MARYKGIFVVVFVNLIKGLKKFAHLFVKKVEQVLQSVVGIDFVMH